MRKFLLIGIVFLVALFLYLSMMNAKELDNAKELNWENNYKKALATAKKENKMVYLFIGADVCTHCDRFKEQTLSNKELIETMKEDYVLLYMSRDQHKIPDGFEKYGVPMHYFLTSDANVTAVVKGSRELEGWYDVLDEIDLMKEK
ncbi:MAG: Thymidylate kinase (EC [uncultured Sulfurovum sp.]|uniref:Thymidylate kinase (EC) n=1 Tax=uncultured Sulfurovum sp. TaxID=269237 RepID=A0A6S6T024_9BACT|nr:MAG: Thymidylate kinase (EC [uncultured Sulfurovum sp.]